MEGFKTWVQAVWIVIFIIFNTFVFAWLVVDLESGSFEKKHIIPVIFFALEFLFLTLFAWG